MTRPSDTHYGEEDHLSRFPVTPAGGHAASTDDLLKLGEYLYERCHDARFMEGVKKYGKEFYKETRNRVEHGGDMEGSTYEGRGSSVEFGVSLDDGKTTVILMDRDASEADKKEGRLKQTYARGFYHEIRGALEDDKKDEKSSESFVKRFAGGKKSKEFEDLGEARKSWQEIVYADRPKDDSFTR